MKAAATAARERLYLVDAHAYLHRAYHAMPPLTNSKGEPIGALLGFARALLLIIKRDKPERLAVCFDAPGPTFRHKQLESYKATRKPTEPDLKWQLGAARELVAGMGLPAVELPGWEADDLMATLASRGEAGGFDVVLVSGDKDALQLVGGRVTVLNEAKGIVFDPGKVEEKFKVAPSQLVDYLALTGDVSDNVPGVPGIGAVGAAKLLGRFKTLEGLLKAAADGHPDVPAKAAQSLRDSADSARLGRTLVTLDRDAPIELEPKDCRYGLLSGKADERLIEALKRFEFNALLRELAPGTSPAEPPGNGPSPAPPQVVKSRKVEAEIVLKKAVKAGGIALVVSRPAQPELLSPTIEAAGAAESGECAALPEKLLRSKEAGALLASPKSLKVGHDLKVLKAALAEAGLEVSGPRFDTWLAAYCLNPGRAKYPLAALLEEAGLAAPADDPVAQAAALWPLRERQQAELEAKGLSGLYRDLELPLLDILSGMEAAGIAVDLPYLARLKGEFETAIAGLKREMDKLAGVEINLNSTKQLAKLLFEDLKLPVIHKTAKGGSSTDEETLKALAPQHPLPAKLIEYRELSKLKSTYIEALLAKADPKTGRVHTTFNQAGTATGRLSSLDPNLQNIPIRSSLGQKIRRAFVAGKGQVLLSADYSQIDLRVLAHLSGDPALCEAFQDGGDIHTRTASEVFGVPPEQVDKELRRRAKAVNFGIVYGQGPFALSQDLGIPFAEAKRFVQLYFERYAGVRAWIQANLESAREKGLVRTLLGRIRYVPEIHAKGPARASAERIAGNTPIQGGSADIIKAAMVAIDRKMAGGARKARLLLQVHDELVFEVPRADARAFGQWVRAEMERAVTLKVPLVVDLKAGSNWAEMEAVEP